MKIKKYGTSSKKKALSKKDEKALEKLQFTARFKDGHYEVGISWKENAKLPNSKWLAEKQLKQLKAKFPTKPVLKEKYEETLQKDLENGYVETILHVPTTQSQFLTYLIIWSQMKICLKFDGQLTHPASLEANLSTQICWKAWTCSSILLGLICVSDNVISQYPPTLSKCFCKSFRVIISSFLVEPKRQKKKNMNTLATYFVQRHHLAFHRTLYFVLQKVNIFLRYLILFNAISPWTICIFSPTTLKRL